MSGIAEGDTIVAEGAGLLKAGTRITELKSDNDKEDEK